MAASGVIICFSLVSKSTGGYTSGQLVPLAGAGVLQVAKDTGAYVDAIGTLTESGGGDYAYEFDSTELGAHLSLLKVVLAGFYEVHEAKDIGDPAQVSDVTAAITAINSHTDTALAALQADLETAIDAVHGAVWSTTLGALTGNRSARQIMVGVFSALLGSAANLEESAGEFFAADGSTPVITFTIDASGNRVCTLSLGAP